MSMDLDPSLLQDFLTESAELIEQLDQDLVQMEAASAEQQQEVCNSCFRALHTIKGAASFLGLTAVTTFAHAAEDALNKLRKGEVAVNATIMDTLLQSADVVRGQVEALTAGDEAPEGPQSLIDKLHGIAESTEAAPEEKNGGAEAEAPEPEPEENDEWMPLELGTSKLDLLEFMTADLRDTTAQIKQSITEVRDQSTRGEAGAQIQCLIEQCQRTAEFFALPPLTNLIELITEATPKISDLEESVINDVCLRLTAVATLIEAQSEAMDQKRLLKLSIETLGANLRQVLNNKPLDEAHQVAVDTDVETLLVIDGVHASKEGSSSEEAKAGNEENVAASPANPNLALVGDQRKGGEPAPSTAPTASATPTPATPAATTNDAKPVAAENERRSQEERRQPNERRQQAPAVEQTIRVEVGRLESLLNMVGQLVLNKNRMLALTRTLRNEEIEQELHEQFTAAAGDLDRLTGELQVGVMRTRMQPLAKLFDRYPRVIRDIARVTGKKIDLVIDGKDTEVDKSVLESLADPLVHILRNSADHGIEMPEDRTANGKSNNGTIRLLAEHQGSHVRVAIEDDGKGLSRSLIGDKAVEKGMYTREQINQMPDEEIYQLIFAAGFSTAKQVSDLSGRGVGMDVVRTNIQKVNGEINIQSTEGKGTTIEILIPLTVAIMPAMVVGVGNHLYSIPLQCVVEIVKPEDMGEHTVSGYPVIRLRDSVLPLLDMTTILDEAHKEDSGRFAVVISVGGNRVGLRVDRLVGQQEIVIKPLDDAYTQGGPFSGATIREDGEVSLIIDVARLVREGSQQFPSQGSTAMKPDTTSGIAA